jgi:quercetin dioxygenase-like cupin family protein
MAHVGQVITNPITHEQITFRKTTQETDGQMLVFDCTVTPGGTPLPPHVHTTQEERFAMISGTLGVMCGGETRILTPGRQAVLPAGIKHQWWNAGHEQARFRVEAAPARHLERVLEAVSVMAHDGRMNRHGMPKNPFELANLGRLSETYVPGVPIILQKLAIGAASALGRLLGYKPDFSQYRMIEAASEVAGEPSQHDAA